MANTSRTQPGATKIKAQDPVQQLTNTFEKNRNAIIGVIVALAVLIGGYFGYRNLIVAPKEEKAANALFPAERWFEVDSLSYVLNGDGQNAGVLTIINKYGSTKAANMAHYYAGMSYLRLGDAKNAILHLGKFDGKGTPFQYLAQGAMGDAYMENKEVDKGIAAYKKAAANEKDEFTTPLYLFRAGLASELNGKTDEAVKCYKEIKEKYPYSVQAREIDKYLARVGVVTTD